MNAKYIWKNGELLPWERAQVHVMSHALHYGTSVFEGIRAYEIGDKAAILCGREHYERLLFSCKVARIPSPLTVGQWMEVSAETLRANGHRAAYIRPLVYRGAGDSLGLDARSHPAEALLATTRWGAYLGEAALTGGVDVQVSSWRRHGPGAASTLAKIGGQYINGQAIAMEARENGLSEGIALDAHGFVSEGSGENVFLVHRNEIFTPSVGSSILSGITRQCVMRIARDLGYTVTEASLPREMLYLADEIFFTGTAVEICPVRSIDRMPVGNGARGPVTKAIQDRYFGIVHGTHADRWNWLTMVPVAVPSSDEVRA
ncbi:branched-chain amino acid transaminase [Burkholderia glumae]|uniref:Branched-chain-amino-acid aminotransferase n=1 Tax=Burkholderia glumae TaxID=337 RepID=A0AAP9XY33_BURGL|nr:branched-chain amino acid transaminase [Burkholderia glumae]ACR30739.1 Branched-chain amino acid aminotransferase [Burkholderia glumae BGR1]AJY64443.1 branched-chain amino acid aminotransferase [Burkholderia glumae LMG 2196 = ATCC 33617]KHJ63282.1 branched-chain amino acid aminotransferase [Burkholderia glumae]MCM2483957.1 branched-chain amino acid transaminase [Burkholderia glumae]MCM2494305.1 branched-chain amino acid transaminase [Burkholderia glumae]